MTQERQDHNSTSPWWGEHMHRYKLCLNYFKAENKRVLDIACGNGYGSHFIYKNGFEVIGADISNSTIINCKKNYTTKFGYSKNFKDKLFVNYFK
mgnify:CR=1 FL=1